MLSLFRKNSFFNSILLLIYAFILQIIPAVMGTGRGFFGNSSGSSFLASSSHILILFFQAIFINRLVIENRLHRDIMLFPGLFFILTASILPEFWSPSHIHFANFIIIWSIFELFQIYKTTNPAIHIFNSAFLIGVASILCPPMLWYLALVLIGISNLKKMELVHPLQIGIGGIVPWFLWLTYNYWQGTEARAWNSFSNHIGFNFRSLWVDPTAMWRYIFFAIILLMLFLLYNEFRKKKHIQAQKKIDILFVALSISVIIMFFHVPANTNSLLMLTPVIGIFMGLLFSLSKKNTMQELIHLVLFFGVLIMQLFYYFNV